MADTDSILKQNPPDRHHYIPAFYTRRWAGVDGRLIVFSRPHKQIIDRRLHPEATGYLKGLYQLRDFEPELAQQMEERFFKPVDNSANEALCAMERDGNSVRWTGGLRTGWTRFILSLLLRCPEDIKLLRDYWDGEYGRTDAASEAKYASIRKAGDPPTFRDWIARRPIFESEKTLFEIYQNLIDNENIGGYINEMHWSVIDTAVSPFQLLTSDRPVIRTNGLKQEKGHLAIPIGPDRLFVAAHDRQFLDALRKTPVRDVVMQSNREVVRSAQRFAYAKQLSAHEMRFVMDQFGSRLQPRLLEGMIDRRRKGEGITS